MKKIFFLLMASWLLFNQVNAQFQNQKKINVQDSLKKILQNNDYKVKHRVLMRLGIYYQYYKGDSALYYFNKAVSLSRENKDDFLLYESLSYISLTARQTVGDYPLSLSAAIESMKIASKTKISANKNYWYKQNLAQTYASLNNKKLALEYINLAWPIAKRNGSDFNPFELARTYFTIEEIDSSYKYIKKVIETEKKLPPEKRYAAAFIGMADVIKARGLHDSAIIYYKEAVKYSLIKSSKKNYLEATSGLADTYFKILQLDSAIHYGNQVIINSQDLTYNEGLLKAYEVLYESYKRKKLLDSSFKYLEKHKQLISDLRNTSKINEAQNIALSEVAKLKELEEERLLQQKRLITVSVILIFIAFGVYYNGKRKQKLLLQKSEEDRKDKELQAAKELQLSLLPKKLPRRDDLDIATFIRSSTEVGGDYYDFHIKQDGTIISICGDATGHGVASGMMVSVTKAALKGLGIEKPAETLSQLNNIIKDIDLGKLRMSLNLANITTNEIVLSSAAMPPMYFYNAKNKTIEELMIQSLPLGGLRNMVFDSIHKKFESGDVLIQLSDGLPEAPNKKGEMYDYEQLKNLLNSSCHLSAQEIIEVLIKSVDEWMEGQHNPDDITLVITKKK